MASPPVKTRLATIDDATTIHQIVNWAYRGGKPTKAKPIFQEEQLIDGHRVSLAEIERIIKDPTYSTENIILVAEDSAATVIGCIKLESNPKHPEEIELGLFAVDPDLSGQGYGKLLLTTAIDHAVTVMKKTVAAIWVLEPREDILAWYKRNGFTETGESVNLFDVQSDVGVLRAGRDKIMLICLKKSIA